ncbi:GDP-Man:Man(3)GlcNAc(2)-PP-Dol alpha-1,2-mannosyltransferase isoform X2 [Coccinella septempunctata]|uniref:GDP-Man:Man(3)GlcNAc(2)-PP-Dol alpha-1,2-mannosyltransferase isoform X2 n=1 Tax=Coccinella septempunctata TaxID=41139 RepID=UPI001D0965FC|nr:GDP-Man:Man(3)GlcNAc(2)-PP-Dol alpha-1,2-mannosyltransferase isoform X2 [Coccinella septempunctata]
MLVEEEKEFCGWLWKHYKKRYHTAEFYIYTGDIDVSAEEILLKVKNVMNIDIQKNIKFIYLTKRSWIEASKYPCFTLLGQAVGSMYLGFEALQRFTPDIMIDTIGLTFAMFIFKYIGGCRTGSYIHYPIITKEMTKRVSNREIMYNNSGRIARSPFLTFGKIIYYKYFALMYSYAGKFSDITLVNSTFTLEHLSVLWNSPLHLVYPPCDVDYFKKIKRSAERPEKIKILSLAQFRPEKNHALQLQALYELREIIPEGVFERICLVLIGSCRNANDEVLVKDLKDLSKHLSLDNNVQFKVNVSFEELNKELEEAFIGIHTMQDEHFGISVVEQMASGLIVVAHRSGGPVLDIIETSEGSRLGFLAVCPQDYAHSIKYILKADEDEINAIRERARSSVDRFSTEKFRNEFLRAIGPIFRF